MTSNYYDYQIFLAGRKLSFSQSNFTYVLDNLTGEEWLTDPTLI